MKLLFLAMLLIGSTGFSAQSKLECVYHYSPTMSESIDISPNTTYAIITHGSDTSVLIHSIDFDVITYVKNEIQKSGISDGLFYGLRRDDKTDVLVAATVGEIVNGQVAKVKSSQWNFGTADGSVILSGPQTLDNLSCTRTPLE